ncbi:MAG: type II toxin-antitoxin system RelE family toxin [Thermoplasmata archaeon]
MRVELTVSAESELYRLPRPAIESLRSTFEKLAEEPFESGPGYRVKRLRDPGGRWVVRVGRHGAIYRVEGVGSSNSGPRSSRNSGPTPHPVGGGSS